MLCFIFPDAGIASHMLMLPHSLCCPLCCIHAIVVYCCICCCYRYVICRFLYLAFLLVFVILFVCLLLWVMRVKLLLLHASMNSLGWMRINKYRCHSASWRMSKVMVDIINRYSTSLCILFLHSSIKCSMSSLVCCDVDVRGIEWVSVYVDDHIWFDE